MTADIFTFTKGTTMTRVEPPCDTETRIQPLEKAMADFQRAVTELLSFPAQQTAYYREFGRGFNTLVEAEIRKLKKRQSFNDYFLTNRRR